MCILLVPGNRSKKTPTELPGSGVFLTMLVLLYKKKVFPETKSLKKKKITGNAGCSGHHIEVSYREH